MRKVIYFQALTPWPVLTNRKRLPRSRRLRLISRRLVYQGSGVGSVYEADVRFPNGGRQTYSYLVKRPFVVVVALDRKGVVLVSQHRYPERRETWELVKGGMEAGETPLAAARRELEEETGLRAKHWQRLGRFVIAPGYFNQAGYVYLARGFSAGRAQAESSGEHLLVRQAAWGALWRLVSSGKLYDSTSLAGLWMAERRLIGGVRGRE